MKVHIIFPLLSCLALTGCENGKVDDSVAKEIEQVSDEAVTKVEQAKQTVEAKAEKQLEQTGEDVDDVITRAERWLAGADERLAAAKAKAKAEGRDRGSELDAKVAKAKANVEKKLKAAKRATIEQSRKAIDELDAALSELDAALEVHAAS
jgi:hypothetical protein